MCDEEPTLPAMLRELTALDVAAFGRLAFGRDPLRRLFGPDETAALAARAAVCGHECAREVAARCGSDDALTVARALGITVSFPELAAEDDAVFARFEPPDRIAVSARIVQRAEALLEESAVAAVLSPLPLTAVLVAHEVFHYWEEARRDTIFTRTHKAELWAPWPFRNRSCVRCLGEIAGMAFAQELTRLAYSPFVLDVFLVYGYSRAAARALYRDMLSAARTREGHFVEENDSGHL